MQCLFGDEKSLKILKKERKGKVRITERVGVLKECLEESTMNDPKVKPGLNAQIKL